ncbi:MAG: pyruvate, phosphate dikinase [Planctomycetota bacterium]|jgi:pyruvate,orthophosphate dikinase
MTRYVYAFGGGTADGDAGMKDILGGKGANLAEMARIGLPVPPGFTITTEVCREYYRNDRNYPEGLWEQVDSSLAALEELTGKKFGDPERPLLLSVRSGAAISMPGMMDTVLNLGLNREVAEGLAAITGSERMVWDLYRRLVNMFGDVVMGVEHGYFEEAMSELKAEVGAVQDTDLRAEHLRTLTERYLEIYREYTGEEFPTDPKEQLRKASGAVVTSWETERAVKYREIHKITGLLGTAVNVQTMVYGNMGETSGTGVAFTRDPSTGENKFYGEFLMNAQGEDVVAGIRTPLPIEKLGDVLPACYSQLLEVRETLENHYGDIQDLEFTIENGELFILQTRTGKRTAFAAIRIAVELVEQGLIDRETAIRRIEPQHLDQLLHPMFDLEAERHPVAKGLAASPGAAVGRAVFTADDAEEWAARGESVILVRAETSPEDIGGMHAAKGILTSRGGMTSHAAVVARGMGKPCVAGCGALLVDTEAKVAGVEATDARFGEGDWISIDGSAGEVMAGQIPTIEPRLGGSVEKLLEWADEIRRLKVRTNADTPEDSRRAREFGAQGIGLCRTEHMFFGEDRIPAVRAMILASDEYGRRQALTELLPMQRSDFEGIFEAMDGLPVTIRLLDPPLHEFLPHDEESQREMAERMGITLEAVREKVEALTEFNPMLGHRGCRLGLTYPEIYEMQVRAIGEASLAAQKRGVSVYPEIMIPLVGTAEELRPLREMAERVMGEVYATEGIVDYMVGTMIEIPRACLTADEVAKHADFFSFGTNDLTQMTFGYSRDDSGTFLPYYVMEHVLPEDPVVSLDVEGVGLLVRAGVKKGRATKPDLKVGICGEHGGDPASIRFCHDVGLDYVSCSPFRVPIARLAAAQAALQVEADSGTV